MIQAVTRPTENRAFLDTCRQARKLKQAMPAMVRMASIRADSIDTPAIPNHPAVKIKPPGGIPDPGAICAERYLALTPVLRSRFDLLKQCSKLAELGWG